jgi:hypothetical protein
MATNTSSTSRPVALDRLEVFVGRWITEGSTAPSPEAPAAQIVASDVYAWAPPEAVS